MLVEVRIATRSLEDQTRILEQFAELAPKEWSFGVKWDNESEHFLLLGDSEEQLELLIDRVRAQTDLAFHVGAPEVAYRETLSRSVTIRHTHNGHLAPTCEFADISIAFRPLERGLGFVFENSAPDDAVPKEFIPAIEKGIRAQKESGLLAGFPVVDFQATLIDSKYHEIDSSPLSFEIAARAAFRELAKENIAVLLEPVMKVRIVTPDDFLIGVIDDLKVRHGRVQNTDGRGNMRVVTALVPLANMFGFANKLRSMSEGRAQYSMEFHRYEQVPAPQDDDPDFRPAIGMRA